MLKKLPSTFTIVFYMVIVAAIMTWFIPGGEYVRETLYVGENSREVVKDNSFSFVEQQPQTWSVLFALFKGFVDKADIIIFVLIVGGAFWILNSTKAIDIGVKNFVKHTKRLESNKFFRHIAVDDIIFSLIIIMFSLFGAVFGMSEETIAFIIIFVPMTISMGYDSIVGVCISYVAAHIGFAGAMLNPFTIGIAQGIADIPLFSGLEYRFICWIILTIVAIIFILKYAHKVKKNPEKSPMYKLDNYWRGQKDSGVIDIDNNISENNKTNKNIWLVYGVLSLIQIIISLKYSMSILSIGNSSISLPLIPIFTLLFIVLGFCACKKSLASFNMQLLLFTILYLIIGVLAYQWYIMEISALFLAMGICAGLAANNTFDKVMKLFLEGVSDILVPAIIIGLASGIIYILQEGKIIDTILYGVSEAMKGLGEVASVGLMYIFQTCLNVIMPSGSAKAALTMPIMSQFADLINISRQTAVLAFQFGDGFTNMITPTSGILLGVLGVAKIPYTIWFKWVYKFILALIILGFILLLPTLFFNFNGFQ